MPPVQSHPEGEILPPQPNIIPVEGYAPPEAYSAEQVRRRRQFSVWDPRSAPGTYLLLAINVAVYLWMATHGVGLASPLRPPCCTTAPTIPGSSSTTSGTACSPPPSSMSASGISPPTCGVSGTSASSASRSSAPGA